MKKPETTQAARMSDEAVQAKTGKTWPEWFRILDAAGAMKMNHQEIVGFLNKKHKVGPWWQQMVTVTYEQARGMRDKHQKPEGYEISASRTIAASVDALYKAWQDEKLRSRWMPESIAIRKATVNKSMRITWSDPKSIVSVNFYPKGDGKCQIAVQHGKLPDAKAGERMKAYWSEALDRLEEISQA